MRKSFDTGSTGSRVAAQAFRGAVVEVRPSVFPTMPVTLCSHFLVPFTRSQYITPKRIFNDLAGFSFSPDGKVLATNVLGYYPIVYSVGETKPLAVLTTPEKQYRNRCTVKHGAFGPIGKDGETTYVTGSDDFYGYGWTIPAPEVLAEQELQASGPRPGEPKWLDHAASAPHRSFFVFDGRVADLLSPVSVWAPEAVPDGFQPHELYKPSIRVGGTSLSSTSFVHRSADMYHFAIKQATTRSSTRPSSTPISLCSSHPASNLFVPREICSYRFSRPAS